MGGAYDVICSLKKINELIKKGKLKLEKTKIDVAKNAIEFNNYREIAMDQGYPLYSLLFDSFIDDAVKNNKDESKIALVTKIAANVKLSKVKEEELKWEINAKGIDEVVFKGKNFFEPQLENIDELEPIEKVFDWANERQVFIADPVKIARVIKEFLNKHKNINMKINHIIISFLRLFPKDKHVMTIDDVKSIFFQVEKEWSKIKSQEQTGTEKSHNDTKVYENEK